MNIDEAYPSRYYLKCADLKGKKCRITIDRVEMETVGEDYKPVVYFRGTDKGLVLNKTNANTISDMYGNDTDKWHGQPIVLFPTRADYAGKRVDAIRIEFQQPPPRQHTAPQPIQDAISTERQMRRPATAPQHDERNPPPHDDMNDEIPF